MQSNQIFVKICHGGNPGLPIFQLARAGSSAQMSNLDTGTTNVPKSAMIHMIGKNPIHALPGILTFKRNCKMYWMSLNQTVKASEFLALTGVAQWVGHSPRKQKVAGSIPCQGTCLGWRFHSQLGQIQEAADWCFSVTLIFLILSFFLLLPL